MLIDGILTRGHRIFNGNEDNARTIVVTTYYTLAERHGPSALKDYRRKELHWSKQKALRHSDELDPNWDRNLSGLWERIICDEAQLLKSFDSNITTTVFWLLVAFIIFVTATPIPGGIKDWASYMPFCQSSKASKWWSNKSLQELGFNEDDDPYALPEGHPAEKLQVTMQAYRGWVKNVSNAIDQGFRLGKIWKRTILRRTHGSRIPFADGPFVGDEMPIVQNVVVECKHTEREAGIHKNIEDDLLGKIIIPGSGPKRKPKWSLAIHRRLQILAASTWLLEFDGLFDMKAGKVKQHLSNANFIQEMLRVIFPHASDAELANSSNIPKYVRELCDGAPKVRALIRNVVAQVSILPFAKHFKSYVK